MSDTDEQTDFKRLYDAFLHGYAIGGPLDPEEEKWLRRGIKHLLQELQKPRLSIIEILYGRYLSPPADAARKKAWQEAIGSILTEAPGEASHD